ncbi:glutathione S-transferase domain-containing protein [Prochlorococcus marinus XMU1419]|uniref:glutathione S-transferase n=1 Tax=Prochlorococcus marinus TaxID=1219 RepID=UPI001ADC1F5F|nr:glutathione S-transferase N-terminal domain-containing protein [Prochlorococcus marinus]MBO8233473.1 glutathione S-transferase domain-containing protein [Prochlorococcus marinus XMU1419]MBW3076953.1 glutathione S-transferase [Prochlorococcus marinus str. XMU1419]
MNGILTWTDLNKFEVEDLDRVNGINNSYSNLRLFGHTENDVIVTLYRDRHSWCPYCQKIWLWLEYKRIPYRVKKINMFCYGQKESWFLDKVRSGKLPAIEFKGQVITESDDIIAFLENEFGALGSFITSSHLIKIRELEREIFRSWCNWLCRESFNFIDNSLRKKRFRESISKFDEILSRSKSGFIDPSVSNTSDIEPGVGDIIFIPYMERMNASLIYYKGFNLRSNYRNVDNWLTLFEGTSAYRGTQGDFHTHSHDLPPQMGGCYKESNTKQISYSQSIDSGEGLGNFELNKKCDSNYYIRFALKRVLKHKDNLIKVNPCDKECFEESLRSALTHMITGEVIMPEKLSGKSLRYLKNRISVPRDMPIISARLLRQSLNKIEILSNNNEKDKIPISHRYDQDPRNFISNLL